MNWNTAFNRSNIIKHQVTKVQTQQLFNLCALFDQDGALMLDIGTYHGYSASIMAQAAPRAKIITCNPNLKEVEIALENLKPYKNVTVCPMKSWDILAQWESWGMNGGSGIWDDTGRVNLLDFIFIDGDHNQVARDLGWYKYLVAGGLMLFHDYNPPGCGAESPVLKRTLDAWIKKNGRDFDYRLIDEQRQRGMVGIRRWEEHANDA